MMACFLYVCSLLYPQHLELCLAHSGCSLSIHRIKCKTMLYIDCLWLYTYEFMVLKTCMGSDKYQILDSGSLWRGREGNGIGEGYTGYFNCVCNVLKNLNDTKCSNWIKLGGGYHRCLLYSS